MKKQFQKFVKRGLKWYGFSFCDQQGTCVSKEKAQNAQLVCFNVKMLYAEK